MKTITGVDRLRMELADEAARIILDEGVEDYQLAKQKAADRLTSVAKQRALPRNSEIEQAILTRKALFSSSEDHAYQHKQWVAALSVMRWLQQYNPHLVGSVLSGTAGKHSNISLHLFADAVEEVMFTFLDAGRPYQNCERRLRYGQKYKYLPCLRFTESDIEVEAVILQEIRQVPLSAIDGKPMQRASLKDVYKKVESIKGCYGDSM